MKENHSALQIKESHFNRVARHLVATLTDLKVPQPLIDKIVGIVAPPASGNANTKESEPRPVVSQEPVETPESTPTKEIEKEKVTEEEARNDAQPQSLSESNIQADVGIFDKLMNLADELVLARNQIPLEFNDL